MSSATSARGKEFEDNFCDGFVLKNADHMFEGKFQHQGEIIYDSSKNPLGDIDGHYISVTDKLLIDLLPTSVGITDRSFVVPANFNVYFELTTTEGQTLQRDDNYYIEKKCKFHQKLLNGCSPDHDIPYNHLLILIFNGADHINVAKKFSELCTNYGLKGISVFVSNSVVSAWSAAQTAEVERVRAEQERVRAEQERVRADQERMRADQESMRADHAEEQVRELRRRIDELTIKK